MSMGVLRSVQPLYGPLWQFRNWVATGEANADMTDVVRENPVAEAQELKLMCQHTE